MRLQNRYTSCLIFLCWGIVCGAFCFQVFDSESPTLAAEKETEQAHQVQAESSVLLPSAANEARARAQLLHETIHGVLQVMHRDFFDAEESLSIPSHSLEDVFKELDKSYGVNIRWLAVNAKAMNVDNKPGSQFEHAAVKALSEGKTEFEKITPESYQYVGAIRLSSQCLRCHLPARTNNDARVAGLVITLPLHQKP